MSSVINLSDGELITFPQSKLFYIEKFGPFMQTAPAAWQEFHQIFTNLNIDKSNVQSMVGLSRINENLEEENEMKYTYQAGVILKNSSDDEMSSSEGQLQSRQIHTGKFLKFLLTGPYYHLGEAYPLAFKKIHDNGEQQRNDEFAMEIYLNTPGDTDEENLQTEIYLPVL